jgi:hypothetical protein|eukprot:scaffold907_cov198-Chaetoceros_neogracile.AAC.10
MRPPTQAFREALKVTASGACTVLLSTGLSCIVAVAIERSAHQLQYKLFPHWYDGKVKYALGLPHLQHQRLDSEINKEEQNKEEQQVSSIALVAIRTPKVLLDGQDEQQQYSQRMEVFSAIEENDPISDEEILLASDNSQHRRQSYSEKIEEKAQLLSSERVSKILLTAAMTG